jgi:hypothetical protein
MVFYLNDQKLVLAYSGVHDTSPIESQERIIEEIDYEYLPTCCRNGGPHCHPV